MKSPKHPAKRAPARPAKPLEIVYRRVDELKLDPANPRRHSKKQIRQIANSIRTFGFIVPVLIDRDGRVLAGHGRLLACRELGITEVPTLCLEHLTAAGMPACPRLSAKRPAHLRDAARGPWRLPDNPPVDAPTLVAARNQSNT